MIATLLPTVPMTLWGSEAKVNNEKSADEELAYVLVKLEKQTRRVIVNLHKKKQPGGKDKTITYKKYLIDNRILPAAIADSIFSDVVPQATGGRAWVKMVVPNPRNPNNTGDAVALDMVAALQQGVPSVERKTVDAYYYGEPIVTTPGCLICHGKPAGEPDPYFKEYTKDGWVANEIVGGVIARVAPKKP